MSKYGQINDMSRGWISSNIVHKKIYSMWFLMLRRCFDSWEGYKGCSIHPDFLLLSNFVKWIEKESNYPLLVEDPGCNKWTIDKDGIVPGNKEYAPGKIRLVTRVDNVTEEIDRNKMRRAIIGVNLKNKKIIFYDAIEYAVKDGFTHSNITVCCNKGRQKTHKGYKWFYTTDLLSVMNYLYNKGDTDA